MERLTSPQLRRLLAVLREIAAARDIDAFPDQVMAAVSRLVAVDSISYNEINPVRPRMVYKISPALSLPTGAIDYLAEHLDQHPVIDYFRRTDWGRPLKISDFLSQQELHRRGIYAILYGPVSTEDQLAFTLPARPPSIVGIALNRSSRSFAERDRLLLDLLRPHLAEAYRTADLLGRYAVTFDLARVGLIALDERGRVLHLNDRAKILLATFFSGDEPGIGGLPASLAAWVQRQQQLGDTDDDAPPPLPALEVARENGYLTTRYVRGDETGNGAMVVFEEQLYPLTGERLRPLGLTTREIDVLQSVEQGRSNLEIARELGVSPGTIRKHLERVYRKLGVSSRTAAVARVRDFVRSREDDR